MGHGDVESSSDSGTSESEPWAQKGMMDGKMSLSQTSSFNLSRKRKKHLLKVQFVWTTFWWNNIPVCDLFSFFEHWLSKMDSTCAGAICFYWAPIWNKGFDLRSFFEIFNLLSTRDFHSRNIKQNPSNNRFLGLSFEPLLFREKKWGTTVIGLFFGRSNMHVGWEFENWSMAEGYDWFLFWFVFFWTDFFDCFFLLECKLQNRAKFPRKNDQWSMPTTLITMEVLYWSRERNSNIFVVCRGANTPWFFESSLVTFDLCIFFNCSDFLNLEKCHVCVFVWLFLFLGNSWDSLNPPVFPNTGTRSP